MRLGISWDTDRFDDAASGWPEIVAEAEQADQLGFHSVWLAEGRERPADVSAPSVFLSYLARRTNNVQLRISGRRVTRGLPAHIAEEVAILCE